MIEKGVFLTGNEAELLTRALADVKTKAFEESELTLDDAQALNVIVSGFRTSGNGEKEKEIRRSHLLGKRLVLGTIISAQDGNGYENGTHC